MAVAYRLRNTDTGTVYEVHGTALNPNAPHMTDVWVSKLGERGVMAWNPADMVSKWHALVAVDSDGNPQTSFPTSRPVKLYDRTASQSMFVLGSSNLGLFFRFENDAPDRVRTILASQLRMDGGRYVALCDHYRTVNDTCPHCDADEGGLWALMDAHGTRVSVPTSGSRSVELGVIYQHADCTWSVATPEGEIIATDVADHTTVMQVLATDHKRRSLLGAYNDNVLFDARRLDAAAATHVEQVDRAEQIADAVRLLMKLGVTTPEMFVAKLAAITEENKRVAESYQGLADRLAETHEIVDHGNATIIQPRR